MYVATVPNRQSPPAILLRESYREDGKVKSRTLANLTHWKPERIEALRRALKGDFDDLIGHGEVVCGLVFGVLFVLKAIADRLGLTRAMGRVLFARLALFLVLARVAHQGSRLSAVRWAENHAVSEVLDLPVFDEDQLYAALDWLCTYQETIENRLYRSYVKKHGTPPALVLYDVTSAYLEGTKNELAAFGYDRDKKRGKMQIVVGLLTAMDGDPLAVKVFKGNSSDSQTIGEQIDLLRRRFGITEVVFVGDRGMVKSNGKAALGQAGFKYITALTDPQIRRLLKTHVLQPDLFDETVHEVEHEGLRYVLRRNEATRRKEALRREDKLRRLMAKVEKRNAFVRSSNRANPEAGLNKLFSWLIAHKLTSFVSLSIKDREIVVDIDKEAMADDALLDGCYVIETDVESTLMDTQTVHDRFLDLQSVERDFRTLKTTLLEIRPIFLRKETRTRAHVFVAMLALKIVREMRRCLVAEFGTTDDDKMAVTVEDALATLGRFCLETYRMNDKVSFVRLPLPDERQARILAALGTPLPRSVHKRVGRANIKS